MFGQKLVSKVIKLVLGLELEKRFFFHYRNFKKNVGNNLIICYFNITFLLVKIE